MKYKVIKIEEVSSKRGKFHKIILIKDGDVKKSVITGTLLPTSDYYIIATNDAPPAKLLNSIIEIADNQWEEHGLNTSERGISYHSMHLLA
jgi:hypothetical protein